MALAQSQMLIGADEIDLETKADYSVNGMTTFESILRFDDVSTTQWP